LIPGTSEGNDVVTDSVVAYHPKERRWQAITAMETPRARFRLVAAAGYLYAIGGLAQGGDNLSTVERYDPHSDSWTPRASMNEPRGLPGAAAVSRGSEQLIAVVGGSSGPLFLRSTEIYDVARNQWRLLPAELPRGVTSLAAATESDGTLLAIGGTITTPHGTRNATHDVLALRLDS